MSLILDALKKAEADRRKAQPKSTVSTITAEGPPKSRRRGLFALLLLGGLGCVALLAWWLYPWAPPAGPLAAARVDGRPTSVRRPQEREPAGPAIVVPPPVQPVTAPEPEPESEVKIEPKPKPEPAEPGSHRVALSPLQPAEAVAPKTVPSIRDLAPADRARLPELNLQLHFFTADPARRLVRINGTNLHEGEAVGSLRVIQIRPVDVVLGVGGVEFALPAGRP